VPASQPPDPQDPDAGSFGVPYELPPQDEAMLDGYEGVPWAYQKVDLKTGVVSRAGDAAKTAVVGDDKGQEEVSVTELMGEEEQEVVEALVYIGHGESTTPDSRKEEYIFRMNRAVDEARKQFDLPDWYIDDVMRKFIPPM
jgi:gamma-glutamylcyclotransferase